MIKSALILGLKPWGANSFFVKKIEKNIFYVIYILNMECINGTLFGLFSHMFSHSSSIPVFLYRNVFLESKTFNFFAFLLNYFFIFLPLQSFFNKAKLSKFFIGDLFTNSSSWVYRNIFTKVESHMKFHLYPMAISIMYWFMTCKEKIIFYDLIIRNEN